MWLALKVHYATFKVRKFELLFHKINTCLQKTATCIGLQAEQIFCQYRILGVVFVVLLSMLFPKPPASCGKKIWNKFCCLVLLFVWAQSVSQIFKILFQTGDINIFVLCGIFFSTYVQLKTYFPGKKTAVKSETQFNREAIRN